MSKKDYNNSLYLMFRLAQFMKKFIEFPPFLIVLFLQPSSAENSEVCLGIILYDNLENKMMMCLYIYFFAIEISDRFGCTVSKHRCEWSKITEESNDGKLKVKRPCSRFHRWFELQRSERINPTFRLLHKYHITGNMYWRRIKKVHKRVTKIKTSWYEAGLVNKLYGRKRKMLGITWPSSSWASEDLQLVMWLGKKINARPET